VVFKLIWYFNFVIFFSFSSLITFPSCHRTRSTSSSSPSTTLLPRVLSHSEHIIVDVGELDKYIDTDYGSIDNIKNNKFEVNELKNINIQKCNGQCCSYAQKDERKQ
jgi:hypothetical protein